MRLRGFKLSWREAGPPNHLNDKVDSDQEVFNTELSLSGRLVQSGLRAVVPVARPQNYSGERKGPVLERRVFFPLSVQERKNGEEKRGHDTCKCIRELGVYRLRGLGFRV